MSTLFSDIAQIKKTLIQNKLRFYFSFPFFQTKGIYFVLFKKASSIPEILKQKKISFEFFKVQNQTFIYEYIMQEKSFENTAKQFLMKKEGPTKKLYLEHTSCNPTGPLSLGRLRGAIIGNTLAKLFKYHKNFKVTTGFFCNDLGKQVSVQMEIFSKLGSKPREEEILKAYSQTKRSTGPVHEKYRPKVVSFWNKKIFSCLKKFKISFSKIFYESEFTKQNLQKEKTILTNSGRKRFLISNHISTYFYRDFLYCTTILKDFPNNLFIFGQDHEEHARDMRDLLAKKQLPYNYSTFCFVCDEKGKLSTRKNYSSLPNLLKELSSTFSTSLANSRNLLVFAVGLQETSKVLRLSDLFLPSKKKDLSLFLKQNRHLQSEDSKKELRIFLCSFFFICDQVAESKKVHLLFRYFFFFLKKKKPTTKLDRSLFHHVGKLCEKILFK